MRKSKSFDNVCFSAHRDHPYTIGDQQFSEIAIFKGKVHHGLHAFVNLSDAMEELKEVRREERYSGSLELGEPSKLFIYECTIPRHAKFYTGIWEYHWPLKFIPNIVSDSMTVDKLVVLEKDVEKQQKWDEKQARKAARKAAETQALIDGEVPMDYLDF